MQAIWRKEWIHEFETPWSIFEKLSLVNRINRNDIFSFLGNDNVKKLQKHSMGDTRRELFYLSGFNETTLKLIFGIDIVKFTKKTIWSLAEPLAKHKYPIESWFYQNLRWCKRCISNGYHSWLHQFKLLQKCSFHNCDLIDACPKCNRKIPFLLSNKQMGEPFTCKCSYRMGDFNESLWSKWNRKSQIIDEATLLWLSSKIHLDDRYLLVPEMSNINLLVKPISFFLKVRAHQDEKLVSIDDFYFEKNISKYLYRKNAASFHTLDRYIRKKLINHHYQCIRQFEQLLKNENDEFPEICPIAYAYVNWKKGVLKKEHFYRDTMRNKIPLISGRYGYELLTASITEELKNILVGFIMKEEKGVNIKLLEWIQEQCTYHFCLNYFFNCLLFSSCILKQRKKTLSWDKILKKTKEEFKLVVRYTEKQAVGRLKNILTLEIITENRKSSYFTGNICPNNSTRKKRAISKMESFIPLELAIDGTKRKQINYVKAYINKHD
ncbi:hypothetical protein NST84_15720 [Paenibacillus sp. FSL R7-0345]|uniref:hypothetical protein n=1 Tax=Paenibacillus sp. FSL R7-0345 TaxID=2954535 RepID=UPI003159F884